MDNGVKQVRAGAPRKEYTQSKMAISKLALASWLEEDWLRIVDSMVSTADDCTPLFFLLLEGEEEPGGLGGARQLRAAESLEAACAHR